jgi:hypothetical protein
MSIRWLYEQLVQKTDWMHPRLGSFENPKSFHGYGAPLVLSAINIGKSAGVRGISNYANIHAMYEQRGREKATSR